jgi:aminoglycoside N3'-acetyltransferase
MNVKYNSDEFKKTLIEIGLARGDNVFIHSSLKTIGKYEDLSQPDLLNMIKNTVIDIIGENGFFAVPTFTLNFAKGDDFDVENTSSEGVGIFSEFIRKSDKSRRTSHPMHSISIMGKNSDYIANLNGETEFSKGSAFDYMLQKNCKILFLGDSFTETFFHIAEEKAKVPYRFWKTFKGNLIKNSVKNKIEIQYYARSLEIKPEPDIDVPKIFKFLDNKNIFTKSNNNKINLMICSLNSYVENCLAKLKKDSKYFLLGSNIS